MHYCATELNEGTLDERKEVVSGAVDEFMNVGMQECVPCCRGSLTVVCCSCVRACVWGMDMLF